MSDIRSYILPNQTFLSTINSRGSIRLGEVSDLDLSTLNDGSVLVYNGTELKFVATTNLNNPNTTIQGGSFIGTPGARIITKHSSISGQAPLVSDILQGELALNSADGKLYFKTANNTIDSFGSIFDAPSLNRDNTFTGNQTIIGSIYVKDSLGNITSSISNLGTAHFSSVNSLTLTPLVTGFSISGGTINSKVLTVSNSITLAGSDGATLNIGSGGTLGSAAYTSSAAYDPAGSASAITLIGLGGLAKANNLSELTPTAGTARVNLGLGTAATHSSTDFAASSSFIAGSGALTGPAIPLTLGTAAGHASADFDPAGAAASAQAAAQSYADGLVVGLVQDLGNYDASITNAFPVAGSGVSGAIAKGDLWRISSVALSGPLAGYSIGSSIRALTDAPGQDAAKWGILEGAFPWIPENISNRDLTSAAIAADVTNSTNYPSRKAMVDWIRGSSLGSIQPTTVNSLTLTSLATGFTVSGGTASKTLTIPLDASVSGTNTGDVSVTAGTGLGLTNQVLTLGTASASASGSLTSSDWQTFAEIASTGVYSFSGIVTNSGDPTHKVDVPAAKGWIINNTGASASSPTITSIAYAGQTAVALTYLGSADATYFLLNSSGVLYQQTAHPTPTQRRDNILLGKVAHPNRSTILTINNTSDYVVSPMSALRDMFQSIALINDGVTCSPNGSNLSFNTSAGDLYGLGINWATDPKTPNKFSASAAAPRSFYYRTQLGGTTGSVSVIDPANYDLGGTVTSCPGSSSQSTNQRIYMYATGVVNIQYGQALYKDLPTALAAQQTETFIKAPNAAGSAILLGILAVRKGATALNNTTHAVFTPASMFGENVGGVNGISTTTLQQAYLNSVTPEIVTNDTLGPLSLQSGASSGDSAAVLETVNSSNVPTSSITGLGGAVFTSVNTLNLSGAATGFSIAGGTSQKTLVLNVDTDMLTIQNIITRGRVY